MLKVQLANVELRTAKSVQDHLGFPQTDKNVQSRVASDGKYYGFFNKDSTI